MTKANLTPYGDVAFRSLLCSATQSAWFRFHNKSEELENLYFAVALTLALECQESSRIGLIDRKLVPPSRDDCMSDLRRLFSSKSKTFSLASLLLPKAQADAHCILFVERSTIGQMKAMRIRCEMRWMHGKIIYLMTSWTIITPSGTLGSKKEAFLTELMQAMLMEQQSVRMSSEEQLLGILSWRGRHN